jgi:hypothetical protein
MSLTVLLALLCCELQAAFSLESHVHIVMFYDSAVTLQRAIGDGYYCLCALRAFLFNLHKINTLLAAYDCGPV